MASGPFTVVASAARTTTGNSGALDAPEESRLSLIVYCTAVSGTTPSNTLSVEWSTDGTNFAPADPVDAFTALTTAVNAAKSFTVKGSTFRVVWTITGTTPSFTFSIAQMAY